MILEICLIATVIMPSCYSKTLECFQRNISCPDIKTADGFKFVYGFPGGRNISEISVYDNKTLIAHAKTTKRAFTHSSEVMSMDNDSVVTRDCRDLKVDYMLLDGPFVTERCGDYTITVTEKKASDPKGLLKPQRPIIGVTCAVLSLIGSVGLVYWCRSSWKKYLKKQHSVASLPGFFRQLLTCSCHREGISQAERGERGETGHNEGSEIQEGTADALEAQHNGEIGLSEIPSATDQHGSGENGIENDKLESVHVQSIDSTADGRTPQIPSLDHNLNNMGIQLSKNGDLSAPDVNRASNYRAMNRNVRDDPGGVNDTKGQCIVWISERHGSQDHVNEGQPLLSNQRAAIQDFDMIVEAVPLVNKHGFDPDQVSRSTTVPDTDVESMTPNMKNHE